MLRVGRGYRGLTTIQALSPPDLTPSFSTSSSLSSSTSSSSLSSSSSTTPPSPSLPHSLLVSSFAPSVLLTPSPRASFAIPPTYANTPVNLRTFAGQPAKYASISDIVVYGEHGVRGDGWEGVGERVKEVIRSVVEAVEGERERRRHARLACGEYRVYLISDPFKSFELSHPHLVAVDSSGFARNRLDFFARERDEMRVLTQASEIGPGVFLGNSQDVPAGPVEVGAGGAGSTTSLETMGDDGNPAGFAICVEAHDQGSMPDVAMLREVDARLACYEDDQMPVHSFGAVSLSDSTPPSSPSSSHSHSSRSSSQSHLSLPHPQIEHLESLSSASHLPPSHLSPFITQLVTLASFLHSQASSSPLPRRVLIHCADGYTETSLLGLTYVMLSRRCTLPEAYLFLQEDCGRSFFVYPHDVPLLQKIEKRVVEIVRRQVEDGAKGGEGMERSDSGFEEGDANAVNNVVKRKKPQSLPLVAATSMDAPWFFADTFDGHFPSRILSFLYLGNLNHASNALMLKALGITHVVSMGESALTPPRQPPFSLSSAFRTSPSQQLPTNSLWLEERLGQISVLDIDNIADDGIAGIRRTFDNALDFIDEARRAGGKVLVHCRVGVSRSATIVIAYLMRQLELDLKSAYLLTRSRRLNILIQPNLPFAATLHAYEAELLAARDAARVQQGQDPAEDDPREELALAGLKWSNRLEWSFFANEIAVLNERFLSWCVLPLSAHRMRTRR
ncbi:hypothetical protein RQP46_005085 [Phenoliferia psychrophenolica]